MSSMTGAEAFYMHGVEQKEEDKKQLSGRASQDKLGAQAKDSSG